MTVRRITAALLFFATLFLSACGGNSVLPESTETETSAATETGVPTNPLPHDPTGTCVGYAKRDITPESSVPLSGYGNESIRLSKNVLDPLYVACVALRDEAGSTLLLYQLDVVVMPVDFAASLRRIITKATGVPEENILLNATHTHSGPVIGSNDGGIGNWTKKTYAAVREASTAAIADLDRVVSAEIGRANTDRLNFTRRYYAEDGFVTPNYDSRTNNGKILAHEFDADAELQAMRFRRANQKDVILVNWQCHPGMTGGSQKYDVSADFVGAFRSAAEEKLDCNFIYFQGGAGSVQSTSYIKEEIRFTDYKDVGAELEKTLEQALSNTQPVAMGSARAANVTFAGKVNHEKDYLAPQAQSVQNVWRRTANYDQTMFEAKKYGITSPYEADAILLRAGYGETLDMTISAYAFGDFALTAAPLEMFSNTGQDVKAASPFTATFFLGYSNGHFGYMPAAECFDNLGYGVMICKFVKGTAEEIAQTELSLLNQLKNS